MTRDVLIIGLGALGSHILELIATTPGINNIVCADVRDEEGSEITGCTARGVAQRGLYPNIEFRKIDLFDVKDTAELLKELEPRMIINASTLSTWWLPHLLPVEISHKILKAGLGPWTPTHLTLTYNLMKALKKSGVEAKIINCSYADAVNPILARVGLPVTLGGGNLDLLTPRIKMYVAKKLGIPMREVLLFLVCHHGVISSVGEAPFYYKIVVRDKDVTSQFSIEEIRKTVPPLYRPAKALMEAPPQYDIAQSFVKNALGVYFNTGELSHSPGPAGLPGGYPVRLTAEPQVVLPEELTLDEAVRINEHGGRWDGIEKIEDDGTLLVTDEAYNVLKETLNYDCKKFKPEETEKRAKELIACYKDTLKKHRVPMPDWI